MKVLVAIQDGKCVEALGAFIKTYPWPSETQFKVMHVVHPVLVNTYMSLLPSALTESIAEERRKQGDRLAKDFAEQLTQWLNGLPVLQKSIEGEAKMEIVEELEDWGADLVLIGSHGKTGVMGSVSKSVASHSPCSVMVVPIRQREKTHIKEKIHIIV